MKRVLIESVFNPRDPGHLKAIVDMDDPGYWIRRARELLNDATGNDPLCDDRIQTAISLLALARLHGQA